MTTTMIGHYELLTEIGSGAMGKVYRARDTRMERAVALKVLWPQLAEQPIALARFERAARAEARLRHPHVVAVYDTGAADGYRFLVMEYVPGCSLRELLKQPLPIDKALRYFKQILAGLGAAHELGVIHRDLKPGNILIESATDTVKLADFGLARIIEEENSVTQSGEMLGTIEYMAPELTRGESASRQSDLYAAGVVLFRLLTGRLPFAGATSAAILEAHECGTYPLATTIVPKLPQQADAVLARLLACEPANRYADCQSVLADIERWERGKSISQELATPYEPIDHQLERHRIPQWKRTWSLVTSRVRYQWLEVFDRTELTAIRLRNEVTAAEQNLGTARRRLEEATVLRNRVRAKADACRVALRECETDVEKAHEANDEQKVRECLVVKSEEKERAEDLEKEAAESEKVVDLARRQFEEQAATSQELRYNADLLMARRRRLKIEMSVLGLLPANKRRLAERMMATLVLFGPLGAVVVGGWWWAEHRYPLPERPAVSVTTRTSSSPRHEIQRNFTGTFTVVKAIAIGRDRLLMAGLADGTLRGLGLFSNMESLFHDFNKNTPDRIRPVWAVAYDDANNRNHTQEDIRQRSFYRNEGDIVAFSFGSLHRSFGAAHGSGMVTRSTNNITNVFEYNSDKLLASFHDPRGNIIITTHIDMMGRLIAIGDTTRDTSAFINDQLVLVNAPYTGISAFQSTSRRLVIAAGNDSPRTADGKIIRAYVYLVLNNGTKQTGVFTEHDDMITAVEFIGHRWIVVTGSNDGVIKIWDPDKLNVTRTLRGHTGRINSLAMSETGDYLFSASEDGTICIWDLLSGRLIATVIFLPQNNWAVVTPAGKYDCSAEAGNFISLIDGSNEIPLVQERNSAYQAGLLGSVLERVRSL